MYKPLLAAAVLGLMPTLSFAATGTVPFNGEVSSTCVIAVNAAGVLGITTDFTKLSSKVGQGVSGKATVLTTGPEFSLSTSAPTAWNSAPPTGGAGVTFTSFYTATGATTAVDVPGLTPTAMGVGVTDVDVHLEAEKSSGIFPSGSYSADVTILCE